MQVEVLEEKIQLGTELHTQLTNDRPDENPKLAVQKRIQRLSIDESQLSAAQKRLVLEIELAVTKREGLFVKVKMTPTSYFPPGSTSSHSLQPSKGCLASALRQVPLSPSHASWPEA